MRNGEEARIDNYLQSQRPGLARTKGCLRPVPLLVLQYQSSKLQNKDKDKYQSLRSRFSELRSKIGRPVAVNLSRFSMAQRERCARREVRGARDALGEGCARERYVGRDARGNMCAERYALEKRVSVGCLLSYQAFDMASCKWCI